MSSSLWNCEPREYASPDCWNGSARKSLSWTLGPFSGEVSGPTAPRSGIGAVLAGGLAGGIGGAGSDRFGPAPALASRTRKGHPATMLPLMLMIVTGRSTSGPSLCANQLNPGSEFIRAVHVAIGVRRGRSALRPLCHRRPGVGDGMEPNRPVACLLVKCHVDGRR